MMNNRGCSYTLVKGKESWTFNTEHEACEFLGVKPSRVAQSYCGNYKIKGYRAIRGKSTLHHESHTRLHRIWYSMRDRCNREKHSAYSNYGGRGIKVCKEWDEYEAFRDWALTNGYSDSLTLDRIDVNGNYEPSNCRWATMKEQCANKRRNHFVTVNGEKMILTECSNRYGIPKSTLRAREKRGADILTGKRMKEV